MLISGPAGTGKSRGILEKLYACLHKYPGCRILLARKTRESLTESALVTWETEVVPASHPMLNGPKREQRHVYRAGKSELVLAGLDKMSKTLSTQFDLIYVQEATEATEADWEILTRSLRNGVMPYQQLIGDCNPDAPSHWLYQRCEAGKVALFETTHQDNPRIYTRDGTLTDYGDTYIGRLDRLTGVRYQRLRLGKWISAEGVVYEGWNQQVHRIPRDAITRDAAHPIPFAWPRIITIDFGFNDPFVAQWWARDPDGRLVRYREVYFSRRLVRAHAGTIAECIAEDGKLPSAVITDHDSEGRASLERHLGHALKQMGFKLRYFETLAADKRLLPGIDAVSERLAIQPDGYPRLFLMRDSLVETDEYLAESKLPTSTEQEFDVYTWKKDPHGLYTKDEPVDLYNHGMDAMRYAVAAYDLNDGMLARRLSFGGGRV